MTASFIWALTSDTKNNSSANYEVIAKMFLLVLKTFGYIHLVKFNVVVFS